MDDLSSMFTGGSNDSGSTSLPSTFSSNDANPNWYNPTNIDSTGQPLNGQQLLGAANPISGFGPNPGGSYEDLSDAQNGQNGASQTAIYNPSSSASGGNYGRADMWLPNQYDVNGQGFTQGFGSLGGAYGWTSPGDYAGYNSRTAQSMGLNGGDQYAVGDFQNPGSPGSTHNVADVVYDVNGGTGKPVAANNNYEAGTWAGAARQGVETIGAGFLTGGLAAYGAGALGAADVATDAAPAYMGVGSSAGSGAGAGFADSSSGLWDAAESGALKGAATNGAITAARGGNGGQIATGALEGGALGAFGGAVNSANPAGQIGINNPYASTAVNSAITGAASSAATGGSVWGGALSGGLNSGINQGFNYIGNGAANLFKGGGTSVPDSTDFSGGLDSSYLGSMGNGSSPNSYFDPAGSTGLQTQMPQLQGGPSGPFAPNGAPSNIAPDAGSFLNQPGPGVGGGTTASSQMPGSSAPGGTPWGSFMSSLLGNGGMGQLATGINAAYQANNARKNAQNALGSVNSLYAPNSPYAQQMQQTLSRNDAAAGRNSQYGTRAVQLAAALTQGQSNALTSSGYNSMLQRQQQAQQQMPVTLASMASSGWGQNMLGQAGQGINSFFNPTPQPSSDSFGLPG